MFEESFDEISLGDLQALVMAYKIPEGRCFEFKRRGKATDPAPRLIGLRFRGGASLSRNFNKLRRRGGAFRVTSEMKYIIFH